MSTVKGSTISAASTSNVQDALQGKVAGLDIQSARMQGMISKFISVVQDL